jgi:hypothetical protein
LCRLLYGGAQTTLAQSARQTSTLRAFLKIDLQWQHILGVTQPLMMAAEPNTLINHL